MKLQHLLQQLYYEPSLIIPEAHASIRQLIEHRLGQAEGFARAPGKGICGNEVEVEQMQTVDGIAYIPIGGAIGQKLSPFDRGDGAVDVLDVMQELDEAEEDRTVRGAILDMDSPGGMVTGTPELADRIEQFEKPIYAFSRGMIASAAYWIAAATDGIFTTRTCSVGSIGVYLPVIDYTDYFEMRGVKVELIKAGKLKGLGYPGTSLSDAGREHLQARINEIYRMFTGHVRKRRGEHIADDTMQGQTFLCPEAFERGLIDATVSSIEDVADMIKEGAAISRRRRY